jgi:hypothetical protein
MCSALVISEEDSTSEDPHSVEQNRNRNQQTYVRCEASRGEPGARIYLELYLRDTWISGVGMNKVYLDLFGLEAC